MDKIEQFLKLNVNEFTEKKKDLTYLSWSHAWAEVLKICPSATYKITKDENGIPYFGNPEVGYMVYTSVTIDDLTHEMFLPVMDGANKAMKLEAYSYKTKYGEKEVVAMTMFDVNKAIMRCLTKNLAMFGLGLYIYAGEDLPEGQDEPKKETAEGTRIRSTPKEPPPLWPKMNQAAREAFNKQYGSDFK